MTVSELIAELQKMPQDAEVRVMEPGPSYPYDVNRAPKPDFDKRDGLVSL